MKKTAVIAFSGIAAAISVIFLSLGSVIWVFSYIMPIATGLFMIVLTDLFDRKTGFLTYLCVSVLSLILLNDKESALMYIMFFGYYPILKEKFDRIKPKSLQIIAKLLLFNSSIIIAELICVYVFLIPFDDFLGKWGIVILLAMANILFLVYEKLFSALVLLYQNKLKKRITKHLQ